MRLCVVDFGVAKMMSDRPPERGSEDLLVGTVEFCAPEVLMSQEYPPACDMWSVGLRGLHHNLLRLVDTMFVYHDIIIVYQ